MIELQSKEYQKVYEMVNLSASNRVYPLSIVEGFQKGQIFVDSIENPTCALIWHFCGFGYLEGEPKEDFLAETAALIRNEKKTNPRRLVMEIDHPQWETYFSSHPGISRKERYSFIYTGTGRQQTSLPEGFTLKAIDANILSRLKGRIIPSFSWDWDIDFLKKGKGFCLLYGQEIAATAFSSAVSHEEIDIGVETAEPFRNQGCAALVAQKMVQYVLDTGKRPVWECYTDNIGSRRTAERIGFVLEKKFSFFKVAGE